MSKDKSESHFKFWDCEILAKKWKNGQKKPTLLSMPWVLNQNGLLKVNFSKTPREA